MVSPIKSTLLTAHASAATKEFVSVHTTSDLFPVVQEVFKKYLEPLYGSQEKALSQMIRHGDRRCELLMDNEKAVGILVYKREPQNEFKKLGLSNSFEIKTLMVLNPDENSGKGYASLLVDRIHKVAAKKLADTIHVTVSSNVPQSMAFFTKKGFTSIKEWSDKYVAGTTEYLFSCKVAKKEETAKVEKKVEAAAAEVLAPSRKRKEREEEQAPAVMAQKEPKKAREESANPVVQEAKKQVALTLVKEEAPSPYIKDRRSEDRRGDSYGSSSSADRRGDSYGFSYPRDDRRESQSYSDTPRKPLPNFGAQTSRPYTSYGESVQSPASSSRPSESFDINLPLKQQYLLQIKSGLKTIEGRIYSGQILGYRAGQRIKFFNQQTSVICQIKAIRKYKGFPEMLAAEGFKKCLTDVRTLEQAVSVYHAIPSYQDRAARSGVAAIEIEIIK